MTPTGTRVLLVDDDALLVHRLSRHLRALGFDVSVAAHAEAAGHALRNLLPDLVVLDWNLPDRDGVVLLAAWRAQGVQVPVLVLSGNVSTAHRVCGLRAGADDYLVKPFDVHELVARIEALLRRVGVSAASRTPLRCVFGPYSLDTAAVQLWQCTPGQPQTPCLLAAGEMALLLALARHANHALSRQRLLELLGDAFGERHERSIDLRVARLRDRLGDSAVQPAWLITVRGQGYRLQASLQPIGADAA